MGLDEIRSNWREDILRLAEKFGASNLRVFGSLARGEGGDSSDLDLLVEMAPGRSYLDLIGFWQDVEDLLGCQIDVVADGGISPYLRDAINREAIPL